MDERVKYVYYSAFPPEVRRWCDKYAYLLGEYAEIHFSGRYWNSGRNIRTIVEYVKRIKGDDPAKVFDLSRQSLLWLSRFYRRVPTGVFEIMGLFMNERYGADVFEDVGYSVYDLHTTGVVEIIARLLFSPRLIYQHLMRFCRFFTNAVRLEVKNVRREGAVVIFRPVGGYPQSRNACLYNKGILKAAPLVCGVGPAHVEEEVCCVNYFDPVLVSGRRFIVKEKTIFERGRGNSVTPVGMVDGRGRKILDGGREVCGDFCRYVVTWEEERADIKERLEHPVIKENIRVAIGMLEEYEEETQQFIFSEEGVLPPGSDFKVISFSEKYGLTRREKEILMRFLLGMSIEEIAEELGISEETVKTHKKNIFSKTGSHSLIQLIAKVREEV